VINDTPSQGSVTTWTWFRCGGLVGSFTITLLRIYCCVCLERIF